MIPYISFLFVALTIFIIFLMAKTKFGKSIYAVGSNEKTARLTGISVKGVKISVFAVTGVLVGIASFIQACKIGNVTPASSGTSYEMYAIAAVVLAAAKESGKYLMIGQNQRLAKAHSKAKELIEQGAIGKVLTFRTIFGHGGPETWSVDPGKNTWFFDKTKAAMGAMAVLGIHKTDMIQYVLGIRIVKTQAVLTTLDKRDATGGLIGVDDNAICIYQMENGVIGTMTASWTYYAAEDNTTVIYGTKGELRLYDDPKYSVQQLGADGTRIDYQIDQIQTNDNQTAPGIIDLFVDCLVEKKEPEISGENVLHAMKAVFASIESSAKGCVVEVK